MSKAADNGDEAKVMQLATKCTYQASRWVTERQDRHKALEGAGSIVDEMKRIAESSGLVGGECSF